MSQQEGRAAAVKDALLTSDWNFWGADTTYLTHSAHRYSGKFIPQISGQAIELLSRPGDLVVDPYCGSGTTLVEAAMRGRRAVGIDMNPLAVLIASVKITLIPENLLNGFWDRMQKLVASLDETGLFSGGLGSATDDDPRLSDEWYNKWFQPAVLKDLIAIQRGVLDEQDERLQRAGLVAFSDSLRRASNAHQGYPNVMFDRRGGLRPRPGKSFLRAVKQLLTAILSLPADDRWKRVEVYEGDARELKLSDDVAQAVVTHPPYVGSIPYAEYGALSLRWLGYDYKDLDRRLTGGQRQSRHILERFTGDYARMIVEAHRVIRPGGYLFVLVGDPTIKGSVINLSKMTIDHATAAGLTTLAVTKRSAENRRANKMGDETLLTFTKT